MAYGNYGGTCFVGKQDRMEENCDVSILELLGLKERIPFSGESGKDSGWEREISHCWVGDKDSTFIIQMYKTFPSRIVYIGEDCNKFEVLDIDLGWDYDESEIHHVEINHDGKHVDVRMEYQSYPSLLRVEFTDPSGRHWIGKTGYQYGKGF